jgi:hypothetical protein
MVDNDDVFVNPYLRPPVVGGYTLTDIVNGSLEQASKLHTAFWQGIVDPTGEVSNGKLRGDLAFVGPGGFAYIAEPTDTIQDPADRSLTIPDWMYPDANGVLLYDSTDWTVNPTTGARSTTHPSGHANSFTMYHLGLIMTALGDRHHALDFSPQITAPIVPNSGVAPGAYNIHSSVKNFIQHTNVRSGVKSHDDTSHLNSAKNSAFGDQMQAYVEYRVSGTYKLSLEREFLGHQHNIVNLLGLGSAYDNDQNIGRLSAIETYTSGAGNVISFGPDANTVTLSNLSKISGIYNGAILTIGKEGSQTFDPKEFAQPGEKSPDVLDADGNVLQAGKPIPLEALAAVKPLSNDFMPSISYDVPLGADGSQYQEFTIISGPTVEGGSDVITDPDVIDFIDVVAIERDDPDYIVPDYRYSVDQVSRITNFNWTMNKLNVNPFVLGLKSLHNPFHHLQIQYGLNAFLDGVYTTLDGDGNVIQPTISLPADTQGYEHDSDVFTPDGGKAFYENDNVWSWSDRYVFGPPQATHPSISPNGFNVAFSGRYLEYDISFSGLAPYQWDAHDGTASHDFSSWNGGPIILDVYNDDGTGSGFKGGFLPELTLPEAHLLSRLTGEGSRTHWQYEATGVHGEVGEGWNQGMNHHIEAVAFRTGIWISPIHHNNQYQDQYSILPPDLVNITRTANNFFPGPYGYNPATDSSAISYPHFWDNKADIGRDTFDPDWSPDGNKIAYTNCMFAHYPVDVLKAAPKLQYQVIADFILNPNFPIEYEPGGPNRSFTDDDIRAAVWGKCKVIWPNITEFTCLPDTFEAWNASGWIPENIHDNYTPAGLAYYRNKLMFYATPAYTKLGMAARGWRKSDLDRSDAGFPGGQFLPQWSTPGQASGMWGDQTEQEVTGPRRNRKTSAGTIQVMLNTGTGPDGTVKPVNVIGGNTTINEIATTYKNNVRDDHWFKKYIDSDTYSEVMGELGNNIITAFPYCWHPSWAPSGDEIIFVSNRDSPIDWIPAGVVDPLHNHFALEDPDDKTKQMAYGELAQHFKSQLMALNFAPEDIDRAAMELIVKQWEPIPVIGYRYYMGPGIDRALAETHRSSDIADEGSSWISDDGFLKFYMKMSANHGWQGPTFISKDIRFRSPSQPKGYVGEFYSTLARGAPSWTAAASASNSLTGRLFDSAVSYTTPGLIPSPTVPGGFEFDTTLYGGALTLSDIDETYRKQTAFYGRSLRAVTDTDYNECPQYYPNDIYIIGCDQTNPEANTPANMIRLTTETGAYGRPVFSPDETMVAYEKWALGPDGQLEQGKYSQIWIMDFDKTTKVSSNHRVVVSQAASFRPRWSSDSKRILYSSNLNREGLNSVGVIYGGRKAPGPTGGNDKYNTVDKRKAFYPIHNLTSWVLDLDNNNIARMDDKQFSTGNIIVQDYTMADWHEGPNGKTHLVYQTTSHSDNYSHQNAFELATAEVKFHNGPSTRLSRDRYRPKLDGVEFKISNPDGTTFLPTPPASSGEAMLPMWTSLSSDSQRLVLGHIPAPANSTHNSSTTIPAEDYYRRINAAAAGSGTTVKDEAEAIIAEIYNQGLGPSIDLGWNSIVPTVPPPVLGGIFNIILRRAVYITPSAPTIDIDFIIDRGPSLAARLYYLVGADVTQTNIISREVQEVSQAKTILSMTESSGSANVMAGITSLEFRSVANLVSKSSL